MAKVKLSALVSDISGKLNGSVFQRSPGGLIIRQNASKKHSFSGHASKAISAYHAAFETYGGFSTQVKGLIEQRSRQYPIFSKMTGKVPLPASVYYARLMSLIALTGIPLSPNFFLGATRTRFLIKTYGYWLSGSVLRFRLEVENAATGAYLIFYIAEARAKTWPSTPGSWSYFGRSAAGSGLFDYNVGAVKPNAFYNSGYYFWLKVVLVNFATGEYIQEQVFPVVNSTNPQPWP